jgi:hypothetical protein
MNRHSEFEFGPAYFPGLFGANGRLTSFCKGNSSTQSNPNNSQTVQDSRVGASEGSIVAQTGASVTVQNLSADVIAANDAALASVAQSSAETSRAALDGMRAASSDSSYSSSLSAQAAARSASDSAYSSADVAKTAIAGAGNNLVDALGFGRDIYNASVNSNEYANDNVASIAKAALGFANTNQASVNDLIQHTNDSFTQKLVANQGLAASSLQDNFGKYAVIGAVIVVVGIIFIASKKS